MTSVIKNARLAEHDLITTMLYKHHVNVICANCFAYKLALVCT